MDNQIALLRVAGGDAAVAEGVAGEGAGRLRPGRAAGRNPARSTKEEFDLRKEALLVAQAQVEEALQGVYQVRVSLGLPPKPRERRRPRRTCPPDLDQTFSSVRQAQASLMQAAAQLGVSDSFNKTPKQMVADFYKRDPDGDIDRIYAKLLKDAPLVKQAEAKLVQAQRDLDQAELNLSYCDVVAEIDGVVTRRNVNPGNNVIAGQSLMAVRSLTEIWVDANFKETQLGRPADRPAGRSGRRHVRQAATLQGPHHRLHDGHRLDAGAAAGGERDGQLREGRAAAAGPDRRWSTTTRTRRRCSSACR